MPSYFTPKKNTEFVFYLSLVSQSNTKIMQVNPTIAAGDFKVSTDGGSLSNLSTLPVVTPAGSKMVKVTLSASEMNGDNVTIVASDASGSEWADLTTNIHTTASQIDDLASPAQVSTEVGLVVSGHGLDHLIAASVTGTDIADDSIFARLVSKEATADWDDYINTTDSLQAIRDQGDSAWITAVGFSTHSIDDVSREVGLVVSGHGLDHLLSTSVAGADIADDSIIAKLVSESGTADWDSYNNTTDSLEAIRNRGDVDWITATGFSTHTPADINTQVGLIVSGHGLDHLLQTSVAGADIADDSIIAQLVSKQATADWDDYDNTTDSLEALRDQGDSAWITAVGFSTLSSDDVSREVGLVVSGHNLDNFVFTTANKVDARIDYVGGNSVTTPNDFKADVSNLDVAVSSLADAGEVSREVGLVVSGHGLDHLLQTSVAGADIADDSIFAQLAASGATADWDTFDNTTDSLQSIRDVEPHGTVMRGTDGANTVVPDAAGVAPTAVEIRTEMDSNSTQLSIIASDVVNIDGSSIPSTGDINTEMGLVVSGHGLDNFVFTTANKVDARVDYVGANAVTTPNDFKADVSNLDAAVSSLADPAEVNREIGLVISGHGLDHLLLQSVAGTDITDNSIFARLVSKEATADWDDFNNTTDSLQAIRDRGDVAWIGGGAVTAEDVNREVGLVVSGHGLDHLLLQSVAGSDITDNSIFAKLVSASATADWDTFVNTTDSLEAIRDRGDAAWIGGGAVTAEDVNREVGLVVSGHGLDHLVLQSATGTDVTDDSLFAQLVSASATADWDTFDNTTDSLQAIRDVEPHGTAMRGTDGANTTVPDAAGVAPTAIEIRQEIDSNSTQLSTIAGDVLNIDGASIPSTGEINTEVGLVISGHGLDNFVFTTANKVDARVDYVGANAVTTPNDFKADVSNLDVAVSSLADPAEVNREVGLVISGHGLDHILQTSVAGVDIADDSIVAQLVSKSATADWDSFDNTTESLEAIRDRGDTAWTGGGGITTGDINAQVGLVISGHGLDHLLQTSVAGSDIADNSIFASLVSKEATADWDDYVNTTDSLQALRDQGDLAWITAVGFSTLSSDDVNREVGLVVSGHNLDNFVFTTANKVDARIDYVGSNSVTTPDDFKATVTNLDVAVSSLASPAEVNREVGLVISGHGLDHLLLQSVTGTDITDDSVIAQLVSASATADWDDFDNTSDSLQAIRDNILVSGDLPTNFSSFSIDVSGRVDVSKLGGGTEAVTNLKAAVETVIVGTVDTTNFSSTTTQFESDDITEATDDHYNGREIVFTSGILRDQATSITDYTLSGSNGKFTVVALSEAPGNNDTFIIV
jgi:hypothetical protein